MVLVDDTLDDILSESGDEQESDDIITQVLDEIGIEMSGKVRFFTSQIRNFVMYVFKFVDVCSSNSTER